MAKKAKNLQYYEAIGRRKESVARIRMYLSDKTKGTTVDGKKINVGEIVVNDLPLATYFKREVEQKKSTFPLTITENSNRFAISIRVTGGGTAGQVDAIAHGLARALTLVDSDLKTTLRKHEFITRDPRAKERRKVGTGGKARRQKQSPKR